MTTHNLARYLTAASLAAVFVLSTGCGDAQQPNSSVRGTVKYNDQAITHGTVNLLSASGSGGQGEINESGGFKIESIAPGEYRVYVNPPMPVQLAPGSKPATPPAKFDVPPRFQDPMQSGVKITLKPGANEGVVIDFKD